MIVYKLQVYLKKDIEQFGDIPSSIKLVEQNKFVSVDAPMGTISYYRYEEEVDNEQAALVKVNAVSMAGLSIFKDQTLTVYPTYLIGKIVLIKSLIQAPF